MKILFDFLTLNYKNGAAEYTRRVFYALLDVVLSGDMTKIQIWCLYDSKALPKYEDLSPKVLKSDWIQFIDYQIGAAAINEMGFDVFFLGCAHSGGWHQEISKYICKSIIVVHDCVWEEMYANDISIYLSLNGDDLFRYREQEPRGKRIYWEIKSPTIRFCRWLLYSRAHGLLEMDSKMLKPSMELFEKRKDNEIITVSNYSRSSLLYNFEVPEDRVTVMYSPERVYNDPDSFMGTVCNKKLRRLIDKGTKYFLIVSAGRENKNAKKAIRAFQTYSKKRNDVLLLTVGFKKETFANHIDLAFLNDWDLQEAYKHCYAFLFPSVFEGFGYPPFEAMKYGKPVLSSNVCSMPEILGDAPIYFSPFYESAIFNALLSLNEQNYDYYSDKSICQYEKIKTRQKEDLNRLVKKILQLK